MPNVKKIQAPHSATGKTIYAIIKKESDGYLLNDADGTFASAPADPYLALTEHGTIKGLYEASESRTAWADSRYTVMAYEQAGGSPAPSTDTKVASGEMKVENDVEVEEITLPEIEGSNVLAKEATVQSILTIVTLLKKYVRNKKEIVTTAGVKSLVIYDDNGTTEIVRKTLKDPSGADISDLAVGMLAIENASSV